MFEPTFKVIGIDEDNDDQPLDNLNFDTTPRSSGTFQPPTPLEIPAESIQKSHETEGIKNATKSIPVLVPPPVLDPNRKSDLPQMPKLVPCPSPRRPTSAGSSRKSPSRKRKSSPAQTELPVNSSILQPPVLQPPKLTAITPLKTTMSSTDNEQPQKEPPITGTGHIEIISENPNATCGKSDITKFKLTGINCVSDRVKVNSEKVTPREPDIDLSSVLICQPPEDLTIINKKTQNLQKSTCEYGNCMASRMRSPFS